MLEYLGLIIFEILGYQAFVLGRLPTQKLENMIFEGGICHAFPFYLSSLATEVYNILAFVGYYVFDREFWLKVLKVYMYVFFIARL